MVSSPEEFNLFMLRFFYPLALIWGGFCIGYVGGYYQRKKED